MELSTLIGKQILAPNGEILGYVKNAYLTQGNKKVSSLECIDGEENEFYISARAVLSVGDAVMASRSRLAAPTGTACPIGSAAYSYEGEYLGTAGDILLGDSAPVYIIVKDGVRRSYAADCVSCGETMIVYPNKKTKLSATRAKGTARSAAKTEKSSPAKKAIAEHFTQPNSIETKSVISEILSEERNFTAEKSETDYRCNLLGRTVKKSLYDCFGFPIAVAGERITPAVLAAARKNNLLLRLTVNTLTNLY